MLKVALLVAAFVAVVYGQDVNFQLGTYPTDVGGDLKMGCLMGAGQTLDGFYFSNDTKVRSIARYIVTEGTTPNGAGNTLHTLEIRSIVEEDHGTYDCRSKEGQKATATVTIRVTIAEAAPNQNLALDEAGTIVVRVNGYPRPQSIEWSKENAGSTFEVIASRKADNSVTGSSRYDVELHGSLVIKGVTAGDAGIYKLSVSTFTGALNRNIEVKVGAKPAFVTKPNATYTVTKGETLDIPCKLTGANADPTWRQNKTDGTIGPVSTVGRTSVRPDLLEITNTEQSDEGRYSCSASNDFGTATATTVLTHVIDPPTVKITDPGNLVEGKSANLTCTGTGRPLPTITWTKLTNNVYENVAGQMKSPGSSQIVLKSIKQSDSGSYKCTADNGAVIAGVAQIPVESANYSVLSMPKVMIPTMKLAYIVAKSQTKVLRCMATGFPVPTIKFMKDGTALTETPLLTSESAKVTASLNYTVTDAAQLGNITCEAENTLGKANGTIHLAEIAKPGKPTSLKASVVTTTSITITFAAPESDGNSRITGYVIKANGKNYTTFEMTYEIRNLMNGTNYKISVHAKNIAGVGKAAMINETTKNLQLPGAPALKPVEDKLPSTTLEISWDAPEGEVGVVTYDISVCKYNILEKKYDECSVVTKYTETSYTHKDLEPEESYRVTVKSRNAQGPGKAVTKDFMTGKAHVEKKDSGLSSGAVAGIIIIILLIIFIIVDLCCCFFNNCGFSHCCFESCCSGRRGKYAAAEVGEEMEKKGAV